MDSAILFTGSSSIILPAKIEIIDGATRYPGEIEERLLRSLIGPGAEDQRAAKAANSARPRCRGG